MKPPDPFGGDSVEFPALTAVSGHQADQTGLPADHPVGVTVGIALRSCMPESMIPGFVQVGLMPACIGQFFNLKHSLQMESVIKMSCWNRQFKKQRKVLGIASPHDAVDHPHRLVRPERRSPALPRCTPLQSVVMLLNKQ